MHAHSKARRISSLIVSLLAGLAAGCGQSPSAPTEQSARAALETALVAWTRGGAPGELTNGDQPVVVHDTPWSQGERLAAYEILGEDETDDATAEKRFTVRLSLGQPERTEDVQYHVLGASPLMVFRDQDYQRNINMENGPSLIRPGRRSRRPR